MRKLKKISLKEKITKLLPNGEAEITYTDGRKFFKGAFNAKEPNSGPNIFMNTIKNAEIHPKYLVEPTNEIVFREAVIEDRNSIVDLRFLNYFDGDYGMISAYQSLGQKINTEGYITILAIDKVHNLVIGQIYAIFKENSCYIDDIFVAQSYRRNGIGKKLIQLFEEKVGKRVSKITLMVINKNEKAEITKEFYEKLGYSVTYEKPQFFDFNRFDMEKKLK